MLRYAICAYYEYKKYIKNSPPPPSLSMSWKCGCYFLEVMKWILQKNEEMIYVYFFYTQHCIHTQLHTYTQSSIHTQLQTYVFYEFELNLTFY